MADWHLWLPPALTKPRFRLYVAGHTVSVIGGWIQQVAISWLVYRLTGSIFLLGVTGFLLNIFFLLLGALAGLAADRLPRLPMLIAIDVFLAAMAMLLALMAATDVAAIGPYLAVAIRRHRPTNRCLLPSPARLLSPRIANLTTHTISAGRGSGPALGEG